MFRYSSVVRSFHRSSSSPPSILSVFFSRLFFSLWFQLTFSVCMFIPPWCVFPIGLPVALSSHRSPSGPSSTFICLSSICLLHMSLFLIVIPADFCLFIYVCCILFTMAFTAVYILPFYLFIQLPGAIRLLILVFSVFSLLQFSPSGLFSLSSPLNQCLLTYLCPRLAVRQSGRSASLPTAFSVGMLVGLPRVMLLGTLSPGPHLVG